MLKISTRYLFIVLVLVVVVAAAPAAAQHAKEGSGNVNPADPATFGALPGQTCTSSGGTNCPGAIPDGPGGMLTSSFDVTTCGIIEDANVGVEIVHTWIGDLDITVTSPAGTSVLLFDTACGSDDDMQAIWDDEGGPFPCPPQGFGNWSPVGSLSALDGEAGSGTWSLTIVDNAAFDIGTLLDWSLELTCTAVPTMNEYWLMALVALLLLSGIALVYRRRRA